jgi:nucleotidyltransferase/DNA polymerase involved in DNA repair
MDSDPGAMRVACLLILYLPVQSEQRRNPALANTPLVVGGKRWDAGAVLDCCTRAAAAGVEPGMHLSQAEALCPDARFVPANEEAYNAVHDILVDAARRFTPTVETNRLGLVLANVSSLKRRFDDEADLAQRLVQETIDSSGLDVRLGLGGTRFVAEQAAHAAQSREACIVPPNGDRAFLSPLDISTLPFDPEIERRLRSLGVRTLGAFANLPRLAVIRQFGSHAGALYDMACGEDDQPVQADAPPLQLSRSHAFFEPVSDRMSLLAHVTRMTGDLGREISHRGYQAEGIRLKAEEICGEIHTLGKSVKPPSSNAGQLSRLGARMLGSMTVGGPVTDLSIIVYPLHPFHLGATQLTLFDGASPEEGSTFSRTLRETLRRLWERFGELSVVVASLVIPPKPSPIQVTTDWNGLPRAIVWREHIRKVRCVYEIWRERRRWWGQPIERDYFRLGLEDGQMRVVFRDVRTNRWLLERRHI